MRMAVIEADRYRSRVRIGSRRRGWGCRKIYLSFLTGTKWEKACGNCCTRYGHVTSNCTIDFLIRKHSHFFPSYLLIFSANKDKTNGVREFSVIPSLFPSYISIRLHVCSVARKPHIPASYLENFLWENGIEIFRK